ncbi:hypothetical protein ACSFA2_16700 [Variovorax sp. LT2P21]|uniref:hypothetical protein n=1 Tax=Variovorax sp. LT2P21 TaxID=3443731 RepID=UPI003F465CF4
MADQDDMNAATFAALMALTGRVRALEVINDALQATLLKSLPPLIGPFRTNLNDLAGLGAADLAPESMNAYRAALDLQWRHLDLHQEL